MPVDLMLLAEGVADEPKTKALSDLRSGSTIDKSLLSKFEVKEPAAELVRRQSSGKPDFTALRDVESEKQDLPSSPLSANPFLKQDVAKRTSLPGASTLPDGFLDQQRKDASAAPAADAGLPAAAAVPPTNDDDKPGAGHRVRSAAAKRVLASPRAAEVANEVRLAKELADSVVDEAIHTVFVGEGTWGGDNHAGAATALPESPRESVPSPVRPAESGPGGGSPQNSTEWLLNVNGMSHDAAAVDISDEAPPAEPKSPRGRLSGAKLPSLKNMFGRRSSSGKKVA